MASISPSASGHKSGDPSSPFWKGILTPLSVGAGHQSNGANERSPGRAAGNKSVEVKEEGSGGVGDEKKLLDSRGSVFGSELQWGGLSPGPSPSPSLSPCGSGLWRTGEENKGLKALENGGGDRHEVHGVLLQMKHLEEDTAALRRTLASKIRDNQELEKKLKHLEEMKKDQKTAMQHLETECGELKNEVRRLQAHAQNSSHGVSVAEDLKETKLVRQHEADPKKIGQMECDTAMLSATIEKLKGLLEEKDSKINELEEQDLKGPVIMKGELKMLRNQFESATVHIKTQEIEIERLKALLKKNSIADQMEKIGSEICTQQVPLEKVSAVVIEADNTPNQKVNSDMINSSHGGEHCEESETGKTSLRTIDSPSNRTEDEAVVPYYASKLGKFCGLRIERGKGIKVNHRLDYLHDPENAPFLLSDNKDNVWYKIPKEDGGEELKVVKIKKQSTKEEKPKLIKIKRPFSGCGVDNAPTQPQKKPIWRPGTANMQSVDKIGGGSTAAKPVQVHPIPEAPWETRAQRKPKPPTVPVAKVMWSDFRAEARKAGFEAYMHQKEAAQEMMKIEEEKERKATEHEEERKLRRALQFKARPMPQFSSMSSHQRKP